MYCIYATFSSPGYVRITFADAMDIDVGDVWSVAMLQRWCDAEGYDLTIQ